MNNIYIRHTNNQNYNSVHYKESKQAGFAKFYLPKASDGKTASFLPPNIHVTLYGIKANYITIAMKWLKTLK